MTSERVVPYGQFPMRDTWKRPTYIPDVELSGRRQRRQRRSKASREATLRKKTKSSEKRPKKKQREE